MAEKENSIVWAPTKNPRIKKRREMYWARFQLRGVEVCESLGTRSFTLAERMTEEIESCILLGVNWRKEKELFETAWPEFLTDKSKGIKTRAARATTLGQYIWIGEKWFMPFFKDKRLTEIDEDLWDKYIVHVKSESASEDATIFNHRKYLVAFINWAWKKGKLKERPDLYDPDKANKKDSDEPEGPGKAYTKDELEAFRSKAVMPFKLAVYMAQYMGMRSSEITQLHKNRIDLTKKTITLRAGDTKIGRGRVVPIHKEVVPLMLEQINVTPDSNYLFPNRDDKKRPMDKGGFKKPWAALKVECGAEGRFHDFRHTWITLALTYGMNPVVVSKIAGVSIKVIETVYLHLTDETLINDLSKLRLE